MASVNSYDDIPGGIGDIGTCNDNEIYVKTRIESLNDFIPAATSLKQLVDLCNNYAKDCQVSIDQAKSSFESGAYEDGKHDYVEDLSSMSEQYTNVIGDLDDLSAELENLLSELNADLTFCKDRKETWENAAAFLFKKQQEAEQAAMGGY